MADMPLPRPDPEEIRRWKEQGLIDVGVMYLREGGFGKVPEHRFWDGYQPPQRRRKARR